jgi:hypothetical protein
MPPCSKKLIVPVAAAFSVPMLMRLVASTPPEAAGVSAAIGPVPNATTSIVPALLTVPPLTVRDAWLPAPVADPTMVPELLIVPPLTRNDALLAPVANASIVPEMALMTVPPPTTDTMALLFRPIADPKMVPELVTVPLALIVTSAPP